MNLPNSYFEDFPIEFKQINPEDFPDFNTTEKIIISPNEDGYIKDSLKKHIELSDKNTVVINAGVGQGKTTAIIDIVKQYYDTTDYIIFIASPFVSLVEQYYKDVLEQDIPEESIFRYEVLGNEELPEFWTKRIHIVTANCLLGNPGEDAFINSEVKRYYLDKLKDHCERTNKKAIFIYDEIHDAVQNFQETYIFNLWKWRNIILKNYIISATYNEASKVVIEYLAELTEDKIQIIESERIRFPEKQSELFLHYNDERFYKYDDPIIAQLVRDLISFGKNVDILSYSKKLSEDIIDNKTSGIGHELYQKYDVINNCTSELIMNQRGNRQAPQNKYNPDKCNVGTNFKTGVSIKKDDHAFVIILPPKGASLPFANNYGIFTHSVNSIIQALARQRVKGEIHIILPKPLQFDYETLPFDNLEQIEYFKEFYEEIKDGQEVQEKTKYLALKDQDTILLDFYENTLKANIVNEIEYVGSLSRLQRVRLSFPEYKLYKLANSENYFANETKFFGGDISAYVTYCALTNQFLNCKFVKALGKRELVLKYGEVQKGLWEYCREYYFHDDQRMSLFYFLNDSLFYQKFRDDLFEMNSVKLVTSDGEKVNLLKDGTSKASEIFEKQLLGFVQYFAYPNNQVNEIKFRNGNSFKDASYDRSQYFLEAIAHANNLDVENFNLPEIKNRIKAFRFVGVLRSRMVEAINNYTKENGEVIRFLSTATPFNNFIIEEETSEFNNLIEFLTDDSFIQNRLFSIKGRLERKPLPKQIETLYRVLLEDLFITKTYKLPSGDRKNVKQILVVKPLPIHTNVVNYVFPPDFNFPEEFNQSELTAEQDILLKEYIRKF